MVQQHTVLDRDRVWTADQSETSWQTLSLPSNLSIVFLSCSSSSPKSLLNLWLSGRGRGDLPVAWVLHHSSLDLMKSVWAHHSSELLENLTAYNKSWAGQNPSCSCVSLQAKTEGTVNQQRRKRRGGVLMSPGGRSLMEQDRVFTLSYIIIQQIQRCVHSFHVMPDSPKYVWSAILKILSGFYTNLNVLLFRLVLKWYTLPSLQNKISDILTYQIWIRFYPN